jgi:hypothetical protein
MPVHRGYLLALAAVVVAVIGWPVVAYLVQTHEQQVADRFRSIAGQVADPAGATVRPAHVGAVCTPAPEFVRCVHSSSEDPDAIAAHYRDELSRVAARPASMTCSTLPSRSVRARDCLVRIDQGHHAVLILVRSGVRLEKTGVELDGTDVVVQAV